MALAPPQHFPAAKTRVAPEDDLHIRPDLANAFDQQRQDRPGVRGGIDVGRPQVRHQQMMTAENIQRQETILIVVTMKKPVDLMAMHRVIGGIKIQHQFFGSLMHATG